MWLVICLDGLSVTHPSINRARHRATTLLTPMYYHRAKPPRVKCELTLRVFAMTIMPQGSTVGSVQATDRLMKELREIYRSHSFKQGTTGL